MLILPVSFLLESRGFKQEPVTRHKRQKKRTTGGKVKLLNLLIMCPFLMNPDNILYIQ